MSKINKQGQSLYISQNYLTSKKTIERLLKLTSINKYDHVIEIGAGKGHITKSLVQKSCNVTAVEIDRKLFAALKTVLGKHSNLKLLNIDFLKMRLPICENYKVFSNIPFSITTDIVRKLTGTQNPPIETWLVMEKGAAKRFLGKANENLTSLLLKPFFNLDIIYYFNKEDFHPMPSVDVVLLYIKRKSSSALAFSERDDFNKFLSRSFKYGLSDLLTKKQISAALRYSNLPQIGCSDTILYEQWLCLFRYFSSPDN